MGSIMATLRLIGIAQDEPRLKRLANALRGADFLCVIDAGSPPPAAASPFDQDSNSTIESFITYDTELTRNCSNFQCHLLRNSQ
jgi:hypothetical protein